MEVGEDDIGLGQGGGGCPDLGPDILGGGSLDTILQVRDVGIDATHWGDVGRVLPQGGPQDDR